MAFPPPAAAPKAPPPPMPPKDAPPPMDGGEHETETMPAPPAGGPPDPAKLRAEVEQTLPPPKGDGFSYKKACRLAKSTNDALRAIGKAAGQDIPFEAPDPPKPAKGDRMPGKFPVDTLVPAVVVGDMFAKLDPDYGIDVAALVDDAAVDLVSATLATLAKDRKVMDAVKEATAKPEPDADEKGGPSDGDADNAKPGAEAYV